MFNINLNSILPLVLTLYYFVNLWNQVNRSLPYTIIIGHYYLYD